MTLKENKFSNIESSLNLGPSLSDSMFAAFSDFIYKHTGIVMRDNKKTLLSNRLRKRLKILKFNSYEQYWTLLQDTVKNKDEMYHFLDVVSTNETYFQRGTSHYEITKRHLLPSFIKDHKQHVNIWSAGSSTGEEPYDIAIFMNEYIEKNPFVQFSILATDLSQEVLEVAKKGEYADRKISKLSIEQRNKYFDKINPENSSLSFAREVLRVKPVLKKNLRFHHHNLIKDPYHTGMDIIFCRNVMIYFDRETQKNIVNKFARALNNNGYLFIGHSETLQLVEVNVNPVRFPEGTVYQKKNE